VKAIFQISLICIVGIAFMSCADLTKNLAKDPEVKILDLSIVQFSGQEIDLNLKLNVNNPNPMELKIGKIAYGLSLSGKPVTEGVFDKGLAVPSNGSSDVIVPLKFKYDAVGSILTNLLNKTLTKDYELKGSVEVGWFSIPFTKKGEIQIGK
jgi:LEA14-like dessication related protein